MELDLRLAVDDSPVGVTPLKVKCINPKHNDRTASMAVYTDHVHCFAPQCSFHVNGLAALALLLKTSEETASTEWTKYTSEAVDSYRDRATELAKTTPLPTAHAELLHQQLMTRFASRVEWLNQRGLTTKTIHDMLLGHNGQQFTIPIFDDTGDLLSFRYRADPEHCRPDFVKQHKYMGMPGRNGRYVYPADYVNSDLRDWCILCEGEFDAMILFQEGFPVATITNGAGQLHKLPALLPEWVSQVYILADNDEAGQVAKEQTTIAAQARGMVVLEPIEAMPSTCKDVSEAYQNGWRFQREGE